MQTIPGIKINSENEQQLVEIRTALIHVMNNESLLHNLAHTLDSMGGNAVAGSSLDQAQRAGSTCLARLTAELPAAKTGNYYLVPEVATLLAFEVETDSDDSGSPSSTGINSFSRRIGMASAVKNAVQEMTADLQLLADMAKLSGGSISSNGRITIGQWLRFHGLSVPSNKAQLQQLIDVLGFAGLPAGPALDNYWQLLDTPDESPFNLTDNTRSILTEQSRLLRDDAPSLLFKFGVNVAWEVTGKLPTSLDYRMQRLLSFARRASTSAQPYLNALGWFTDGNAEQPSQAFIDQLLIAAMLLELDPELDNANTAFAGFDLYAKRFLLRNPEAVRLELEQHLVDTFQLQPVIAPVVAHWVLAGMAPQFLVRDLPPELTVGTPAWVILCQAVNLVESITPGVSRAMSYEHLIGFTLIPGLVPQLEPLQAAGALDPVVTWALMNGLIAADADGSLSDAAVSDAIEEYDRYVLALTQAISEADTPVPSRRAIALAELTRRVPGCNPAELLAKFYGNDGWIQPSVSILDLYMGGELAKGSWGRTRGMDVYQQFPALKQLTPADVLYGDAIQAHHAKLTTALSTNIKHALAHMEESERAFLETSRLAIYQLSEERPDTYTDTVFSLASLTKPILRPHIPVKKVARPGRYGVVICAVKGPWIRCYELFPLQMTARFSAALDEQFTFRLLHSTGALVERKLIHDAPVDMLAYTANLLPRPNVTASVVFTKIGEFEASEEAPGFTSPVRTFQSGRVSAIANLIARENPFLTREELSQIGLNQTDREKELETISKVFTVILNLLIPFKECIEELSSGVESRQKNAIGGCITEAALIALSLVAAPFKVVAAVTKGATLAAKLFAASRVAAHAVIALLNPLDGVPGVLKGGAKLVGRRLAKLHATSLPDLARAQLLRLTGANSYDLLKAVKHSGSAPELRMSLDAVDHGRALFKNDRISTAEDVLKHLYAPDKTLLKNIPERELEHLMQNSLADIALNSDSARQLGNVVDPTVVEQLIRRHAQTYYLDNLRQFPEATELADVLSSTMKVEYNNLTAMRAHQTDLLTRDLGKMPYHGIADEIRFNSTGLTENTDRATAWILSASNSQNESAAIRAVLQEFSASNRALTDPATYKELHRRLAPQATDSYRSPRAEVRYPSNITGAAMLEKHLAGIDAAHEHFGKHLIGSFLGYHAFSDGNGRLARAAYAITELRKGRFNALDRATENLLSGLS
ncbi:hypothetical protein [Pseudomonas sp. TMB3-21]